MLGLLQGYFEENRFTKFTEKVVKLPKKLAACQSCVVARFGTIILILRPKPDPVLTDYICYICNPVTVVTTYPKETKNLIMFVAMLPMPMSIPMPKP